MTSQHPRLRSHTLNGWEKWWYGLSIFVVVFDALVSALTQEWLRMGLPILALSWIWTAYVNKTADD